MKNIVELFDAFSIAYQHSLYSINREQELLAKARENYRAELKTKYNKNKSLEATETANHLMAEIFQLKDAYQKLKIQDDSVVKAAEYLDYGTIVPQGIDQILNSDNTLPWIMPFLGHRNLFIESAGNDCQLLGLQFAIRALLQTAPGQLSITVINPDLRPEFSLCSQLPEFRMLNKASDIQEELVSLMEVIIQNDKLLQGRYNSLIELRRTAQQPVGRLRLLIIQDLPQNTSKDDLENLIKIAKGAPRAGIDIIYLASSVNSNNYNAKLKQIPNFYVFTQSGNKWRSNESGLEKLIFDFPILKNEILVQNISEIKEALKNVSVISIPFDQIEDSNNIWTESSEKDLVFNLGKSGMDTVSVCIGNSVTQYNNILISGAAGKGKSNLLEVMIHSLCIRYSPDELELYLLDFKDGLTFKPYAAYEELSWLPHARMLGLESDRDVGLAVLKDLEVERRNRAALFGNSGDGVHDYESFRKINPDKRLPRIVLIIDEYQKLFDIGDEISEEAASCLENLVRQGRACAIHIILASQSITGTVGLLGKEDLIYAQFPVRIALQNTISESFSIFGIGNDAAAKLRVRGEAIINYNYGAVDSNLKFTVAYAQPEKMKSIRQLFCQNCQSEKFPVIFKKKDAVDYSMFIPSVKRWRQSVFEGGSIHLPCGIRISVNKNVLPISMSNDMGKNIAILGAAEDLQAVGTNLGKCNMAVGMLQGFAISLALQHPDGNARFIMIDGLANDVRKNSNIQRWLGLMERLGFPVEVVSPKDAAQWFMMFHQEILAGCEENTYIFGFGMDRCTNFSESDLSGESGASAFQELLKFGTEGVHLICWWSNVSTYNSHIGFNNEGYIGTKVLLRMDTDTARDVLGPFINWGVRDNRAYIHDTSDFAVDMVVMPMLPLSDRTCGKIEAEAW